MKINSKTRVLNLSALCDILLSWLNLYYFEWVKNEVCFELLALSRGEMISGYCRKTAGFDGRCCKPSRVWQIAGKWYVR